FVLRYYGSAGIAARIREHIRLAAQLAERVDAQPDFERLATPQFSTVVFRYKPSGASDGPELDALNERILERVNASGEVFLSHTVAKGRYALRVAIGNLRTTEQHVARAWELIRNAARLDK
ncbi:MAG TPA: pyridoxal-dependent decarboxylase, partial [Longimicrobiales bacterium]